jgi:hypothetical protein
MLHLHDITKAIDSSSQRLTGAHPELSGHIAILGTRLQELVERTGVVSDVSQLFDLCNSIDSDTDLQPHESIGREILLHRTVAMNALLTELYVRKKLTDPDALEHLRDEEAMAAKLAAYLPELRKALPSHTFGPAWLYDHADEALWEAALQFVYDVDSGTEQWERFARLLPQDLRARFDATDTPIDVEEIESVEHAQKLLQILSEKTGIPMTDFADPAKAGHLAAQFPLFHMILEYLATTGTTVQDTLTSAGSAGELLKDAGE